jgi:multidrug transporter EmrE-like cation transporter
VIDEINWLARNGIPRITMCDANFGLFDRDIEIAKAVARAKRAYGYPKQFVMSYPRDQVERVFEIAKILTEAGVVAFGTISLQTLDPTVLNCANRRNVNIEVLKELNKEFRKEGLLLAIDLMIGLPGSTINSVKNDLQFCFDHQLWATCYTTFALPNTLLTDEDYVKKYKIKVGSDCFIISSYSFSEKDLKKMQEVAVAYRLFGAYGLLKYVLWYLQFDHQIKAMDVIHGLTDFFKNSSDTYPEISSVSRSFKESGGHPGSTLCPLPIGGWDAFYDEIRRYLMDRYGVAMDSGLETAFEVQKAVMPEVGRKLPDKIKLQHDFSSYFFECLNRDGTSNQRKLIEYTGQELVISDPHKICENLSRAEIRGTSHIAYWELDTVMSSTKTLTFDIDPSGVD